MTTTTLGQTWNFVLRDDPTFDAALLRPRKAGAESVRRLLLLGVSGLIVHGFVLGFLAMLHADALLNFGANFVFGEVPMAWMPIAYMGAFLGALAISLPAFWFMTLLAGMDLPFRVVVAQALKLQARASILLLGFLPLYFCGGLAAHLLHWPADGLLLVGLGLPFAMGLLCLESLRAGFMRLAESGGGEVRWTYSSKVCAKHSGSFCPATRRSSSSPWRPRWGWRARGPSGWLGCWGRGGRESLLVFSHHALEKPRKVVTYSGCGGLAAVVVYIGHGAVG